MRAKTIPRVLLFCVDEVYGESELGVARLEDGKSILYRKSTSARPLCWVKSGGPPLRHDRIGPVTLHYSAV